MLAQAELLRPQILSGQIKLACSRFFMNKDPGKKSFICLLMSEMFLPDVLFGHLSCSLF